MVATKIKDLEGQSKATERDVLVLAKAKAQRSVNNDPSVSSLAALEKATQMLVDHDARMDPPQPSFDNRMGALKELKHQGYKIGKSKFYEDCKLGLCKVEPDGSILESSLNKYIKHPRSGLKRLDKIQEEKAGKAKTTAEIEKLQEQVAKLRFEREIMQGKYISREDFEVELASVVGQVQTGLHHMLEMRVPDWVALVSGDTGKAKDLLDAAKRALDDRFNDFAKIDKFKVVFEQ